MCISNDKYDRLFSLTKVWYTNIEFQSQNVGPSLNNVVELLIHIPISVKRTSVELMTYVYILLHKTTSMVLYVEQLRRKKSHCDITKLIFFY